jgi:DNA-directed RNA polymerase specialized sigma24 family protein
VQFEDYVQVRGQSLVRFAYVLCNDAHTAEDLAQSALAKAYRHWRRVCAPDHPDAHVQRIIVNTYLSGRRRRSTIELPVSDPTRGGDDAAAPDIADPPTLRGRTSDEQDAHRTGSTSRHAFGVWKQNAHMWSHG